MSERIWIKGCRLQNFESHRDSEIPFSEGFNAVVGKSCAGKSSILRSLRAVTVPNSFCTSWVREGSPFCTIRWETNIGWLEAEKGEGINRFSYWIDGETTDVVKMKSPAGREFDVAKKILGVDSLRIESTGEKRKTNSRIDVNLMKQSSPLGLLGESNKSKAFVFDTLCGILDSEDIREGLKTTINDLKKKDTELISAMSQTKLGGIPPLTVSSAREEYNSLADSFDSVVQCKSRFIEIMTTISIKDDILKTVEDLVNKTQKDCYLPDGGAIDLYRATVKRLTDGVMDSKVLLEGHRTHSDSICEVTGKIQSLGDLTGKDLDCLKSLAGKLFHVEQYVKVRDSLNETSGRIDCLKTDVDLDGLKNLNEKITLLDQWKAVCRDILDSDMKVKKLAVDCSCERVKVLTVAVDDAREIYKKRSSLQVAIGEDGRSLGRYDVEIKRLEADRDKVFDGCDVCPVTGEVLGSQCSVVEWKQKP